MTVNEWQSRPAGIPVLELKDNVGWTKTALRPQTLR
jgi:hypothetical protein